METDQEMEHRITLALPSNFQPTVQFERALQNLVMSKYGPEWEIRSIDATKKKAIIVKKLDSEINDVQQDKLTISVRLPQKYDLDRVVLEIHQKYGNAFALVKLDTLGGVAVFKKLSDDERRCRDAVASVLKQQPWDVQVTKTKKGGFIVNLPPGYRDSQYAVSMNEIAESTIGTPGWSFVASPQTNTGEFVPGKPPTLPKSIPFGHHIDTQNQWHRIYLGEALGTKSDPRTTPLFTDFNENPHMLITGTTGSGKSVTVTTLILHALLGGWKLVILDPVKSGADFAYFAPWTETNGFALSIHSTAEVTEWIQDEFERRRSIIRRHLARNWTELPPGTIQPLMVVFDEVSTALAQLPVPSGGDSDDPVIMELRASNAKRAKVQALLLQLLQSARFSGIFLVLVTQTANNNTGIPPSMRNLMSGRIMMGVSPTEEQQKFSLANPKSVPPVPSWIAQDSNISKGCGVFEFSGYPPGVFKSEFVDVREVSKLLKKHGVKPVSKTPFLAVDADLSYVFEEQIRRTFGSSS